MTKMGVTNKIYTIITFSIVQLILISCELNHSNTIDEGENTYDDITEKTHDKKHSTFSDSGDYKSVIINNQVWMNRNLNSRKFKNGEIILEAKTDQDWLIASKQKQPAWCYYNNNIENGERYGKLYNWYAVNDSRGICPEGWLIPEKKDYEILINNLTNNQTTIFSNLTKENGLNAPMGGWRFNYDFLHLGLYGYYWSATDDDNNFAWALRIDSSRKKVDITSNIKDIGFSVRCIKETK